LISIGHLVCDLTIIERSPSDLLDVSFWLKGELMTLNMICYLSFTIKKVLGHVENGSWNIGILSSPELKFFIEGITIYLKIIQQRKMDDPKWREALKMRLTKIYNYIEKLKSIFASSILDRKSLLAKLESKIKDPLCNSNKSGFECLESIEIYQNLMDVQIDIYHLLKDSSENNSLKAKQLSNNFSGFLYNLYLYSNSWISFQQFMEASKINLKKLCIQNKGILDKDFASQLS